MCESEKTSNRHIELNNARSVLEKMSSRVEDGIQELFLTMVQGNTYSEVTITDKSLKNNATFIVDLWD